LSRTRFDAALVEAARAAGATFLPRTEAAVAGVDADGRRVELVTHGHESPAKAITTARVVLVASGLGPACVSAGGEGPPLARSRAAAGSRVGAGCVLASFPDDYRAGTIFMAVGRRGYVGLVRVEDGRLNVAAAFEAGFLRWHGRAGDAAAAVLA